MSKFDVSKLTDDEIQDVVDHALKDENFVDLCRYILLRTCKEVIPMNAAHTKLTTELTIDDKHYKAELFINWKKIKHRTQ